MSDASLTIGEYLLGAAELAAILSPLAFAAVVLRAWLLPGWQGAPARLAEAVATIALLLWVAQLVGAIGLFDDIPMVAASLLIGGTIWAFTPEPAEGGAESTQPPSPGGMAVAIAAIATALVAAAWAVPLAASYAGGIDGVDSMWYHLPQSAKFVQTGSVVDLHFTDPYFLNWYYPAHSELLHAVPMLAFDRDWLSPLVNHAFLAIGLLAAWCIGRPWGLGSQALVAAAIVFGAEMMLDFQPGEARNDAIGLALFLAAVAFLVTGPRRAWPVIGFAGLAAGLAIGTKLTMLAPVAALAVAVAILAGRGDRLRGAAVFIVVAVAGGGYWYLRNLVHSGNPLPWIDEIGPISLPAPEVALELRPPFSVAHYATDFEVWRDWFSPGLENGIGVLWPAILVLVIGAALAALVPVLVPLVRRRRASVTDAAGPPLPLLGGVVLVTLVAYVLTPLTASGPEGAPEGFVWNLRYIAPALGLGLVVLTLLPPLRGPRMRMITLAGLFAILVIQVVSLDVWDVGQRSWAIGSAILVLGGFALGRWLAARPRTLPRLAAVASALAAVVVVLVAGYAEQDRYMERRYADVLDGLHLDQPIALANTFRDSDIATAGRGGAFFQYGFYGSALSNEVQWLGEPGPRGAWLPLETCEDWREAVNEGGYDFVVTTYDKRFPGLEDTSREREWIRRDPAAEALINEGPVTVYELSGELDPSGCGPREAAAAERPTGVPERDD